MESFQSVIFPLRLTVTLPGTLIHLDDIIPGSRQMARLARLGDHGIDDVVVIFVFGKASIAESEIGADLCSGMDATVIATPTLVTSVRNRAITKLMALLLAIFNLPGFFNLLFDNVRINNASGIIKKTPGPSVIPDIRKLSSLHIRRRRINAHAKKIELRNFLLETPIGFEKIQKLIGVMQKRGIAMTEINRHNGIHNFAEIHDLGSFD